MTTPLLDGPLGPPLREKDACAVLGVSRRTLQLAVENGTVPAPIRVSRLKLYPRATIWRLLNGEPAPEEAANAQ